jgi:hypothetical protein
MTGMLISRKKEKGKFTCPNTTKSDRGLSIARVLFVAHQLEKPGALSKLSGNAFKTLRKGVLWQTVSTDATYLGGFVKFLGHFRWLDVRPSRDPWRRYGIFLLEPMLSVTREGHH